MAKRGKTIYSITIIAIILISFFSMYFVYGLENNYTEFEKVASDYGKISVLNNHNTKLAEYVLLKNSDNCLTNCYAEGTANFYTSGYLFSDLKFKDSKGSLVNINSNKILIKVTEGYQVDVIEYEKVCDSAINGTVCYSEEIGSHKETRYRDVWQEYNNNLLQAGSYEWRIEGSKGPFDNIDWIGSSFGVEFNQWAWWNSNWENCKDLSIETSLNSNNWITELNITGITFVNTTELRIVDSSCGEGGNEVKNTVLQNGSNWAIITWLTNSSGSSLNYSIYYNNPTNPVKASSLELVDEFCEFTTSACGYSNISATTFSITGGILNMSGQGGLKASPIGIKNVLVRFFHNGSDADLASTGLTNTSDVNWDAGAKHENSLFQYSGAHAVLAGFNAPNSFGETTINSSMANQWIVSFMKILTGNTTIFSYNSSGSVGVATKNIAIDDDGGDVFLYLGIKNPVSTIHSWDYVRAYDSESYYVNTIDYSVTLGAEEEYNFAPTTPILLLPSNNSGYEIYSTITFVWENSTDINGDAISKS